jgi:hypothetical protein
LCTEAAAYAADRGERHEPLCAAHSEPDDLRTFTAVIETLAQRAESAIRRAPGAKVLCRIGEMLLALGDHAPEPMVR